MKKFALLLAVLLLLCISACAEKQDDYLSSSVPLEQKQALYPDLNVFSHNAYQLLWFFPDGMPGYTPCGVDWRAPEWVTAEGVSCEVVPKVVSLDFEKFEIKLTTSLEPYILEFSSTPRIERWTGGKWERLYYMPEEFSALCDEPARGYKEGVEEYPYPIGGYREATITVERQYFISPIKPGRYRVVVYAGYLPNSTPVYAEFTVEK